jgi:hypothetical protein
MTSAIRTFKTTEKMLADAGPPPEWLWTNFLVRGKLTLLTSPAKDGKTTLMSTVIAAMERGGTITDSMVVPCRVAIVTEEDDKVWKPRCELLKATGVMPTGDHIEWSTDPYPPEPTWDDWKLFVMSLEDVSADVYVIDPLLHFLPAYAESHNSTVQKAFEPLRELAEKKNAAVLPIHHPSEAAKGPFNFYGGSAQKRFVDIMAELKRLPHTGLKDHRRVLSTIGRFPPPVQRVIELNKSFSGYKVLPDAVLTDSFEAGWVGLKIVLEDASQRLALKELMNQWPPDYEAPARTTLRDWIERALKDGLIDRFGKGRRTSPYRYALPGKKFDPFRGPDFDFCQDERDRYG